MKTGCIFTQSGLDGEGKPVRDADSTTYFSRIGDLEDFSDLLLSEAVKRGLDYAERVVVLGDDAKWIWGLAKESFPDAVQIIDLFHAKEYVYELLRKFYSDEATIQINKTMMHKMLEDGDIDGLADAFSKLPASSEDEIEKIRLESDYFKNNKERMQYKDFSGRGYFVGSGVIEAACKNVIGKRLKQSGMRWSFDGANEISALRYSVLSGEFEPVNFSDSRNCVDRRASIRLCVVSGIVTNVADTSDVNGIFTVSAVSVDDAVANFSVIFDTCSITGKKPAADDNFTAIYDANLPATASYPLQYQKFCNGVMYCIHSELSILEQPRIDKSTAKYCQ
jgi:hypothetical protein